MPTISLSLPASGTVITAGLHVSNYNDLQALLNGNLDASNLANLAVNTGKLADGAVTNPKLAPGMRVTQSDFAAGPPGSPTTGDVWYALGVAGHAIVWQFVYRPEFSGSHDWCFVGGPAARVAHAGPVSTTSTSFIVIDGTTPSITVPRAGQYQCLFGARTGAVNGDAAELAVFRNGVIGAQSSIYNDSTGGVFHAGISMYDEFSVAAGDVIDLRYKTTFGFGPASFYMRYLALIPMRVS